MQNIYDFFMDFEWHQILSSFLLLFAALDTPGNAPVVLNIKKRLKVIHASRVTLASGVIMITFLFCGKFLLELFGIDEPSFAVAGSVVLFLLGLEMILGVSLFHIDAEGGGSVVPLAFPIIAGTGTLATLLTLRAKYADINILCAILVNLVFVYLMLRYAEWIERKLGKAGVSISHKVMGLLLLAMAVKLLRTHLLH